MQLDPPTLVRLTALVSLLAITSPPCALASGHDRSELPAALAPLRGLDDDLASNRVHFDRPGDGNLWVRARRYKARFGSDAVEFVPFLGSSAPRNYPLKLTLESVSCDGQPIDFARAVAATLERAEAPGQGDVVAYYRGDLVEYYVIEAGAIEQRFRIDRPLAAAGHDLLIRVSVDSDLACREDAAGFCFENELGGVRYGRAVTFDRVGRQSASPTRRVANGLEIRVPASFLAGAHYPLTIDPFIEPFSVDPPTLEASFPDVAFDETNQVYAVVWEHGFSSVDHDVYVQMHDPQGNFVPGSDTWIDATSENWTRPRIANNNWADQFLVVAVRGPNYQGVICGRTRAAGSTLMGTREVLSEPQSGLKMHPDVGGDPDADGPTLYFVVWTREESSTNSDISARFVETDGTPDSVFTTIVDSSDGTLDRYPSVSKSNGVGRRASKRWTVAWERALGNDFDIHGAQFDADRNRVTPPFVIDNTTSADRFPTVSTLLDGVLNNRPYLVAYMSGSDAIGYGISGKVLRGNAPQTNRLNLNALENAGNLALDQFLPSVESDGSTFILAYGEDRPGTSWDTYVSEFDYGAGQLVCTSAHNAAHPTTAVQVVPQLTARRSGGGASQHFALVWQSVDPSGSGIDGAIISGQGFGHTYCASNPNTSGNTAHLRVEGSRSVDLAEMQIVAENCPPGRPGLFFLGLAQVDLPFGDGRRCVGGATQRTHPFVTADAGGVARLPFVFDAGYAAFFGAGNLAVNYQFWFRDPQGGPAGFNLSDALHVVHTP